MILIPVGASTLHFFLHRHLLTKVKIRLRQQGSLIRIMSKQHQLLERKIDSLVTMVSSREKETAFNPDPKDIIEHQYERAKRIMKKGTNEDIDILRSCNMTSEEMELLSGLIMTVD